MKIPNQLIPESQKGPEHIEKTVIAIVRACNGSTLQKKNDYEAWRLYTEDFDVNEYDYLRKVGKYTLPAQFRWIGRQRPRINLLASQESKRPWVYSLRVGDMDSKKEKMKNKIKDFLKNVREAIEGKKFVINKTILQLQSQVQQIEQYLQQEPQNEEQAAEMQQIAAQLPEIKLVIERHMKSLHEELALNDKELDNLNMYYRMSWQDMKEMYAQILAEKLKEKKELRKKKIEGLIAKCVTGKPIYYVDYIKGKVLPEFDLLEDVRVFYPRISTIDWIQDGPWVAIEDNYSLDRLLHLIQDEATPEEIKILEEHINYEIYDTNKANKRDSTLGSTMLYDGTEDSITAIKCMRVYYKSPRKIHIKHSPNPYKEGHYFRTFIEEGIKIKADKGEKLEVRYVTDIYEGLYVAPLQKVFRKKKKEYNRTYLDDYTKRDLPVYGETFSRMSKRPYSLIKATEELQKLINIFHFHKELLLAVSGTKGTITDLSQIPKAMSPEEHRYHKKRGSLYIETVTKGGRKINSSFNQWQTYDETLSPAIQYLDNMIESADQMIGNIMGIGPQRMGQVIAGDQVGKTEMAVQQNALVTEILFFEADQVFGKAFEAAINLATKYCLHEGGIISREDSVNGEEQVIIPKGLFKDVEFDLTVANNTEEETSLMELKQLAVQSYMQGKLPFSNIVSMYKVKALKELEMKYEYYESKAMEAAQAAKDGEFEQLKAIKAQEIQLENEYKSMVENQKMQLEGMKLEFEREKLEFEKIKLQVESELKDKEIRTKMATEMYKADTDVVVEEAYLAEQKRQAVTDEQLRQIALKVDTIFRQMELTMAKTKQSYDAVLTSKKIDVDARKAAVQNKKKIKD